MPPPPRQDFLERLATGWVQTYLGRNPTQQELVTMVTQLRSGTPRATVQASILGSNEYFARNGRYLPSWAKAIVRDVLGRPATGAELQNLFIRAGEVGRNQAALELLTLVQTPPAPPVVVVPVPVPVWLGWTGWW